MKTVYKYTALIVDDFEIDMPVGAQILHVDMQHGQPRIWALVDPDAPKKARKFHLAGTGHPIDDKIAASKYVGTFMTPNQMLVFHLFEVPAPAREEEEP
jgi:hypothetical protein